MACTLWLPDHHRVIMAVFPTTLYTILTGGNKAWIRIPNRLGNESERESEGERACGRVEEMETAAAKLQQNLLFVSFCLDSIDKLASAPNHTSARQKYYFHRHFDKCMHGCISSVHHHIFICVEREFLFFRAKSPMARDILLSTASKFK